MRLLHADHLQMCLEEFSKTDEHWGFFSVVILEQRSHESRGLQLSIGFLVF